MKNVLLLNTTLLARAQLLQGQLKKKEECNQKQRERMLAAELRRKQEEESKKQKILKAEGVCTASDVSD